MFSPIVRIAIVLLSLSITIFPQTLNTQTKQTDSAKLMKLKTRWLEKINKDAGALKLSENRAVVYARLGNLYWKTDQNRARSLFIQSVNELIEAEREAERDPNAAVSNFSFFSVSMTRRRVLQLITKNDEALGFESFIKSRPQSVSDVLAGRPLSNPGQIPRSYNDLTPEKSLIRQENELEQGLAMESVALNPKRAIDILRRDSLENVTNVTYSLLRVLRQKDRSTADSIALEIIQKILASDLAQFPTSFRFAGQILAESLPENRPPNRLQIDNAVIHRLAMKEADFLTQNRRIFFSYDDDSLASIKPILIALLPERAAELNEINFSGRSGVSFGSITFNKDLQELIRTGTAERISSEAEKLPPESQNLFYMSVTNRIAVTGDIARAKAILAQKYTGQRLSDLESNLYLAYSRVIIEKGDYDKALELIEQIKPGMQYIPLTDLAVAMQTKDANNNQKARAILERVRQTIPTEASTQEDFIKFSKLASSYVLIEPATGFKMLEALIKKFIEIATANTVVESFRSQSYAARRNEALISNNNIILAMMNISLKNFASADLSKTLNVIGRIARADLRINLELQALESTEQVTMLIGPSMGNF